MAGGRALIALSLNYSAGDCTAYDPARPYSSAAAIPKPAGSIGGVDLIMMVGRVRSWGGQHVIPVATLTSPS